MLAQYIADSIQRSVLAEQTPTYAIELAQGMNAAAKDVKAISCTSGSADRLTGRPESSQGFDGT